MRLVIAIVGFIAMSVTSFAAAADQLQVERFGVYLRVSNLDESRTFYERLLGKEPYISNDSLIGFDVAGGLLALFHEDDAQFIRGSNAVPYIRVNDAQLELARLRRLGVRLRDEEIVVDGPLKLFRFFDLDGNMLEIFSVVR